MTVKCPVRGDNVFYRPQSMVRGNWHYHVTDAYVHSKEETAEIGNEIILRAENCSQGIMMKRWPKMRRRNRDNRMEWRSCKPIFGCTACALAYRK